MPEVQRYHINISVPKQEFLQSKKSWVLVITLNMELIKYYSVCRKNCMFYRWMMMNDEWIFGSCGTVFFSFFRIWSPNWGRQVPSFPSFQLVTWSTTRLTDESPFPTTTSTFHEAWTLPTWSETSPTRCLQVRTPSSVYNLPIFKT